MKPTLKVLVCVLAAGSAFGQSPSIIQNTRDTMTAVSDKNTSASNEALGVQPASKNAAHPAQGKATPVVASASSSKKNDPKQAAPKAEVKVVAVKNTTTTTTVETQTATKTPAMAKATTAKTSVAFASAPSPVSPKAAAKKVSVALAPAVAVQVKTTKPKAQAVAVTAHPAPVAKEVSSAKADATKASSTASAVDDREAEASLPLDSKYGANGRRDPFISPVVSHNAGATACASGKKCLEIGTINLRGVVHGDNGFIAVVSNNVNKAYFLRENDPVFNGYVVKITGDSIVFQETLQDRLGKSFTREVIKKITTPAV